MTETTNGDTTGEKANQSMTKEHGDIQPLEERQSQVNPLEVIEQAAMLYKKDLCCT